MSEVDSSTLQGKDDCTLASKMQLPMQEVDSALKECGFGWFHIRILCASFFGITIATTCTYSISYILPQAECDLNMDLQMKGLLSAALFFGTITSSIVAGFLVDTFGRKLFLVGGYGLFMFFNIVSAMSQTYNMLLFSKFCEGFILAIAYGPTISYTSEFCHDNIRDKVLLAQAAFVPISQILFAGFSWAILMNNWQLNLISGHIVLYTWNIYLLLITIVAMMACILYSFLPESPKYLVTKNRYDEARRILCTVYKINTGKTVETFSYANLWEDKEIPKVEEADQRISLRHQLTIGLHSAKALVQKPHVNNLILISTMLLFVMLLFNFIRMWYPQLATIVEHYATEDNQELCTMLDAYTHDLRLKSTNTTSVETCVPIKSGMETYMNNVILGCSCLPSYLFSSLFVNRIGKKALLIVAGLINIGVTLGLRWSNSKIQVLALFGVSMAISHLIKSLLEASTMQLFPTRMRTLALSVAMTAGRLGSLMGNILIPILLDISAAIPFYSLTGFMVAVTLLAMIHPSKKN